MIEPDDPCLRFEDLMDKGKNTLYEVLSWAIYRDITVHHKEPGCWCIDMIDGKHKGGHSWPL